MIDLVLERRFATPLSAELVRTLSEAAESCFSLHRVAWEGSLLARDGRRMVCRFRAPDVESARNALRQAGAEITTLWPGTIHDAPGLDTGALAAANVLVERAFAAPVSLAAIQAREDAGAACLQNHRVRFVRTLFSRDAKRMLCLYRAPDAESVRLAQHQAGMPLERVWAFQTILPGLPVDSTPVP
ncbi:nickel-binding protein [Halomonas lysinitropha]|uniref:DUF4242 domain-containing protein n=1 Tax=Halomonas lysinitropha TaxID=2607506 RepID=A0A5K1I8X9_9GAMM|nr:nickel-binding protein [Halomonas lysinitropha]VVZ96410.1 hypothetical protein HALO32_02506 [Halomonas lysinitropha]